MTNNEWLALIIGMLLGMSACGVVFLIDLRIRNARKNEERAKHKLASTQQNIGNRIYHFLWDAMDTHLRGEGLYLRKVENGEFSIIASKVMNGYPTFVVRVNLSRSFSPITICFYDNGTEWSCGVTDNDIAQLKGKLVEYLTNYSQ